MARGFDTIRTARLVLRRWRAEDRGPFAAMNADPEVMRYFPAQLDRAASAGIDRAERRFDQQGFGLWALETADTGEFIGFTGLNPMPEGVPGAGMRRIGMTFHSHFDHPAVEVGHAVRPHVAFLLQRPGVGIG